MYLYPSRYLFYVGLSISISCVPTSASISKSVIVSSSSPSLTGWLYALYRLAVNIRFTIFSLILNYPGLKLTVAVYRGLPIGRSLPYIPCNPYIPVWSSNIARHCFWPVKAWDGWPSSPVLKVGNAGKAPASP